MVVVGKEYFEIVKCFYKDSYVLEVTFSDGTSAVVDLSEFLNNPPPVFTALKDKIEFSKVTINPVGGIAWENGADLGAEFIKELSFGKGDRKFKH